jgi:hypothetical protein
MRCGEEMGTREVGDLVWHRADRWVPCVAVALGNCPRAHARGRHDRAVGAGPRGHCARALGCGKEGRGTQGPRLGWISLLLSFLSLLNSIANATNSNSSNMCINQKDHLGSANMCINQKDHLGSANMCINQKDHLGSTDATFHGSPMFLLSK